MTARFLTALCTGLVAAFALSGVGEAAKGPDATEVGVGTIVVVLGVMAFLAIVYGIKVALGGARTPPPEEPAAGPHH